jgi:hypothetical protein
MFYKSRHSLHLQGDLKISVGRWYLPKSPYSIRIHKTAIRTLNLIRFIKQTYDSVCKESER